MDDLGRREALRLGAGAALGGAALSAADAAASQYPSLSYTPEKGAMLRVLRPSRFVPGDEKLWLENTRKFEAKHDVKVRVDSDAWEDLRPKAAVAANIGRGPDVVYGWYDDAHRYPEKLHDLTELANYLGRKYGGWYPVAEKFARRGTRWISLPLGAAGAKIVYRKSWVREAGFDAVPRDTEGFLEVCRALRARSHPPGFALGNAVGDANGWCHWVVWAFGGRMVDEKDNVVINSPETVAALEYARRLYETFVPGTLAWLDPANNKAFLDGEIGLTSNNISIYHAARSSGDPAVKAIAEDIDHADLPVGPVRKPTEIGLVVSAMVFRHSKAPNAAREYIRFMMEKDQYAPWQTASLGYFSQALRVYEAAPLWTTDPKLTPFRDTMVNMLWPSYAGSLGEASAGVLAAFIMVSMVAQAASGLKSPRDAAAEAQRRAEVFYRL